MGPTPGLHQGYVVSDRFQLLRVLGRGGMGNVWVARHLSLNIDVAIKFIDAALAGREDLQSRFAHEARTAARIQSPHVVHILDYGFDGPRPFIAMELLRGETLRARLEREERLPLSVVREVVVQTAKGLARAHALGIVHRDLKPDNLFLCDDDDGSIHVKILDFGIARDDSPVGAPSHRTGTGQLLGTPAYMSPEQALAKANIDLRSDLYSLAVVAYHCLVGRLPFEADTVADLIVSISTLTPPPPSSVTSGMSSGIDAWFKCAFQKEPAARFPSAKEMADTFLLANRESAGAFDATVLADAGSTPVITERSAPPLPDRTRRMTGVMTPAAATIRADAPHVPDTFNGQYATQGATPVHVEPRRRASKVVALVGLSVAIGVIGGAVFVLKGIGSGGAPRAGARGASTASAFASTSTTPSATPTPTPTPTPSATPTPSISPAPRPRTASPPPPRSLAPPKPPTPPTNDYGL